MKLITLILLLFSISTHAQIRFKVPSDKSVIKSLKTTKENHLIILKAYRSQIDSEIKRLAHGIDYETDAGAPKIALRSYDRLMIDLLVKRIFVSELEKQLQSVDLDLHYAKDRKKLVFNSENIKIDLSKQIGIHLDQVLSKDNTIAHYALKDFKKRLIEDTLKTVAVKTYKAIGSGLLAKIVVEGVSSAALKSAFMSLGSEVFVKAGTGTLLTILTLPLHGYRLPPEDVWTDILEDHPELILNPEWMKYAGSTDDPWYSHGYALLRRTERMEKTLSKFLKKEESEFKSRVVSIYKLKDLPKETPKKEISNGHHKPAIDNTYVHRPVLIHDIVPFWAIKR